MNKCKITINDEVWCYITGLKAPHVDLLYSKFGIYVEGYFFMPQYKLGRWDGKAHFFDKSGKTYNRLLDKIIPYIDELGYDFELVDNRKAHIIPKINIDLTEFDNTGIAIAANSNIFPGVEIGDKEFTLRPYQAQCVKTAIEAGSGVVLAGTGAGKTSITAAISQIFAKNNYKVITIVPSSDLVDQTAGWYQLLGMDTGIYSGKSKDINHANVVATWQALQYNPSVMKEFQVVIWDECHGVKASIAQKLLNEDGSHIPFRFGVTGTFPKPESEQYSLFSSVGPILQEISASWLIDNGYLAKVQIQPIELNETYITEKFPDYVSEKSFLNKSPSRMETIANVIVSQAMTKGNTLVLVNSVQFGKKLASLIKGSVFLYGKSESDLRKEHYAMFEEQNDLIVIATSGIASTGISIDRVFNLILVDAGRSFVKAVQSIGRGLRKGRDKNEVYVVDIYSKQNWSKKHANERKKWYKEANYPVLKIETIKIKE